MTPTAGKAAEQIVQENVRGIVPPPENGWYSGLHVRKVVLIQKIADLLQARERAVWEEAARELIKENDYQDDSRWAQAERHWSKQFCLRATQAEGKEAE